MATKGSKLWTNAFYHAVNPEVVFAGFQQAPPGWTSRTTRSLVEDFDLWYIVRGRGAVRIDGRWIEFQEGDLVLLRPGEHYQEERADREDPYVQYFVHLLPFGDDPLGLGGKLARRWPRKMSLLHLGRLRSLFAELFDTFTTKPEGHPLRLKATALEILGILFAVLRHKGGARLPPAYGRLMKAHDYIVTYNRRELTLDEVADHADLSASYLSALFKRHLGCSPIQYQIRVRLRNARRHLAEGLSVSQTADEVGFNSLHYFSRMFKKHFGQTPSAFAESCRRK